MMLWKLFLGFLKVGCFTFGGGYGAVPLIRDVCLGNGWLDDEMLTCMIAVSESTPGPIMVNMATYVGSSQAGFWGALVATAAVVLPSFCIILLVSVLLAAVIDSPWVQAVLRGLKPCVTGIVLATGLTMLLKNGFGSVDALRFDLRALILTAVLAALPIVWKRLRKKKLSPIVLIVISAVAGMLVYGM